MGAHIRNACGLHPIGDAQLRIRIRIRRLENEARKIRRKMDDVLARATCDFKDDARLRQDIVKDIENEITIAQRRRHITGGRRSLFSRVQKHCGSKIANPSSVVADQQDWLRRSARGRCSVRFAFNRNRHDGFYAELHAGIGAGNVRLWGERGRPTAPSVPSRCNAPVS